MAVINSCLLCWWGPSAPIVLKAGGNMCAVYWVFISAPQPIRVTAAHLSGPVERVSGSVQTWPRCYSRAPRWKPALPPRSTLHARHSGGQLCQVWGGSSGPSVTYHAGDLFWDFQSKLHGKPLRWYVCVCVYRGPGWGGGTTRLFHWPDKMRHSK